MGDVIIDQEKLPSPDELYNKGKHDIGNLAELKIGAGSSIFFTDKEGSRWGSIRFDTAQAWIKVDGTAQFKTSDGDVLLSTSATDGNFVNVINTALNTSSKTILQDFTFQSTDYAGAFKSGNPTWDEGTGLITGGSGVLINARGILGAANGVATFTLDATTGNATFAGTLTAASGTLGAITVGSNAWHVDSSGNMWWGSSSTYAGATISISAAGVVAFTSGSFRGTLNADDITAGTLSGRTVKATGGAGSDVWLDSSDGTLKFFHGGNEKGFIYSNSAGDIFASADENFAINFNDGGGTGSFSVSNDGTPQLIIFDSGLIQAAGDIQCGGTFKSSDGTSGTDSTAKGFITSIRASGGNLEAKYREMTFKDGLITNMGSESGWQNMGAY